MDGEDTQFHMNMVLGISEENWSLAAPASGLFKLDGSLNRALWEQKLGLEIESRYQPTQTSSGAEEIFLWFRFLGEQRTDSVR